MSLWPKDVEPIRRVLRSAKGYVGSLIIGNPVFNWQLTSRSCLPLCEAADAVRSGAVQNGSGRASVTDGLEVREGENQQARRRDDRPRFSTDGCP